MCYCQFYNSYRIEACNCFYSLNTFNVVILVFLPDIVCMQQLIPCTSSKHITSNIPLTVHYKTKQPPCWRAFLCWFSFLMVIHYMLFYRSNFFITSSDYLHIKVRQEMIISRLSPAVCNVVAVFIRVFEVTFLTQGQSRSKAQRGLEPAADWLLLHYPAQWTKRGFIHLCIRGKST